VLKAYGGVETYLHQLLTFSLHVKRVTILRFLPLLHRSIGPDVFWIGGWAGPRAELDVTVKRRINPHIGN
jgi:hypothetical protein